nr:Coenzyme F420 hydrogenase/dehydrogenase, beta subunit C-terminal domain [Candidatus Sigynarchaeota archaeon]
MIGDMYLAWSSDEETLKKGEYGGVVTTLLKFALENKIVDAVLTVKKMDGNRYDGVLTLITNPEEVIECAGALHCAPLNIARALKEYLDGSKDMRIAVTCKPCDARAIIELVKREQINIENLVLIGLNCTGTLLPRVARRMFEEIYEVNPDDVVREDIDEGKLIIELRDGTRKEKDLDSLEEAGYGRRENCRRCEISIPRMADLACGKWGTMGKKATFIEVCTEKGSQLLDEAIKAGYLQVETPTREALDERSRKEKEALDRSKKWQEKNFNELKGLNYEERLNYWFNHFDRCIKCFSCRDACPICYCVECRLEVDRNFIPGGELPPDKLFHLTRLAHVGDSCVNCGQCQDACPMEIPISKLFHMLNKELSPLFEYVPGRAADQLPPLTVVTDEELRVDEPYLFLKKEST